MHDNNNLLCLLVLGNIIMIVGVGCKAYRSHACVLSFSSTGIVEGC